MLKFEESITEAERDKEFKLKAQKLAAEFLTRFPPVRRRKTFLLFPKTLEGVRKWGRVTIEEHIRWDWSWPEDHSLCSGPQEVYWYVPIRFI